MWASSGFIGAAALIGGVLILLSSVSIFISDSIEERTGYSAEEQKEIRDRYKEHGKAIIDEKKAEADKSEKERGSESTDAEDVNHDEEKQQSRVPQSKRSDMRPDEKDGEWYYSDGEEKFGPYSREVIERMIEAGELEGGDLVWESGMDDWQRVEIVFDLTSEPPPLPSEDDDVSEESDSPSSPSQGASNNRLDQKSTSGKVRARTGEEKVSDGESQLQSVSFGEWMWTLLVGAIPLVNIVAYLVWAFNGSTNPSKSNWAKATLTWLAIFLVPFLILLSNVDGVNSPTGISAESEVQGQGQMTQSQSETETGSRELREENQTSGENEQSSDDGPITLDDFETDTYGEPGGEIRTWKETALRSSPVSDSESIIGWISEGEVLENAQKSGEYYRIEYNGRDGYVLEYNIEPSDRF